MLDLLLRTAAHRLPGGRLSAARWLFLETRLAVGGPVQVALEPHDAHRNHVLTAWKGLDGAGVGVN